MRQSHNPGTDGSFQRKTHRGRRLLKAAAGAALAGALMLGGPLMGARPDGAKAPRDAKSGAKTADVRPSTAPTAASLIEDREAKKLLAAADSRMQLDQVREGLLLYQQIIERYPRSAVRFDAFMRLGKYHLEKTHEPSKALPYFERAGDPINENADLRGEGTLLVGRCFYEMQKYPQAFSQLRQVIAAFPGTEFSNQAYFYIGNAHYRLGAYNRAIEAFSKVGTAISENVKTRGIAEIGKRLFIRLSDQDLVSLPEGSITTAEVTSSSGDREIVKLNRIGTAISPNYLGEIDTQLGNVKPGNNVLELGGRDTITITYIDAQTASNELNLPRKQELRVLHNAIADFMDGAYRDARKNVVVGLPAYVRVIDYDRDVSDKADTVQVKVLAKRTIRKAEAKEPPADEPSLPKPTTKKGPKTAEPAAPPPEPSEEENKPQTITVDEVTLTLTERPRSQAGEGAEAKPSKEEGVHTGIFVGQVPVLAGEAVKDDGVLQVQVGDVLEMHYLDELNTQAKAIEVVAVCNAAHGSLVELKAPEAAIRDQQLELQTRLKKAEARTNIGRIYKQLGLTEQAFAYYREGIAECEALAARAQLIGGEVLEQMYVRLWKLYIELDELDHAAAMCLALQRDFPNSQFVDEALLGLGETAMKKADYAKAIGIYRRVLELPTSSRKADALFQIGLCQETMAKPAEADAKPNQQQMEQAFTSFQAVWEKYPQSGVAGDAIGKMADFYMLNKDYDRAIAMFQRALDEGTDLQYIDRVLYDYGRCLYRMWDADKSRRQFLDESISKFRQLLSDYPQSKFAPKAKQILPQLEKKRTEGGT
jgi:tetratricopeptide (TPR) repeat protein